MILNTSSTKHKSVQGPTTQIIFLHPPQVAFLSDFFWTCCLKTGFGYPWFKITAQKLLLVLKIKYPAWFWHFFPKTGRETSIPSRPFSSLFLS